MRHVLHWRLQHWYLMCLKGASWSDVKHSLNSICPLLERPQRFIVQYLLPVCFYAVKRTTYSMQPYQTATWSKILSEDTNYTRSHSLQPQRQTASRQVGGGLKLPDGNCASSLASVQWARLVGDSSNDKQNTPAISLRCGGCDCDWYLENMRHESRHVVDPVPRSDTVQWRNCNKQSAEPLNC